MGIMPNDRNQRLESALRRFGIPATPPEPERTQDAPKPDKDRKQSSSDSTPDPRKRIAVRKDKR